MMEMKKDSVVIRINPGLYSLDAVYSASYVFLDRAFIMLEGDPKKEIRVVIRPKDRMTDLEMLKGEFQNELINYSDYQKRSEQTRKVREMILQRALLTNDPFSMQKKSQAGAPEEWLDEPKSAEGSNEDDPEGIMEPWDDRHSDKKSEKATKK
jgi:His-Xaa-Ser system protein HxsD